MTRFVLLFVFNFPWVFILYFGVKKTTKPGVPLETRYAAVKRAVSVINKRSRITLKSSGTEKLPEKDGFVLFANHQGRYDGIGIVASSDRPLSFAPDAKRENVFPINSVFKALDAKPIDKTNRKAAYLAIKEIEQAISEGRNYIIFPEGIYDNSKHNSLYKFHSGCMRIPLNAKCPIVPVCLYDTYKPYNSKGIGRVTCSIEYLDPIYYDEYGTMQPKEVAELVKSRISAAIERFSEGQSPQSAS